MPSIHISRRSTSQAQPTQPSKEKKKISRNYRDYVKRVVGKKAKKLRIEVLEEVRNIFRMRTPSGQVCPNACKGKILFTGKSFKSYFLKLCSFLRNLVLRPALSSRGNFWRAVCTLYEE